MDSSDFPADMSIGLCIRLLRYRHCVVSDMRGSPQVIHRAFSFSIPTLITDTAENLICICPSLVFRQLGHRIGHHGFTVRLGLDNRLRPFQILDCSRHPGLWLLFLVRFVRDRQDLYTRLRCVLLGTRKTPHALRGVNDSTSAFQSNHALR